MTEQRESQKINRLSLLEEFEAAPDWTLFSQMMLAAIRDCSEATLERERVVGGGVPYVKCGRSVRYSKLSILRWIADRIPVESTSQYQYSSSNNKKRIY